MKYFPSDQKPHQAFNNYATATLPLGLTAWIAFSISFVFTNISYLGPIVSDPFGWGWDLFNTAGLGWSPYMAKIVPILQIGVIAGGLYWAGNVLQSIAVEHKAPQQAWPLIIFCTLVSIGLLWLLVG